MHRSSVRRWLCLLGLLLSTTAWGQVILPPPGGKPPPASGGGAPSGGTLDLNLPPTTTTTAGNVPSSAGIQAAGAVPMDPRCGQQLANAVAYNQQNNEKSIDPILRGELIQPSAVSMVSSCVDNLWPHYDFSIPSLDRILQSAESYILNTACAMARDRIQQETSLLNQSLYMNTGIPGAPGFGVSLMDGVGGTGFGGPGTLPITPTLPGGGGLSGGGVLGPPAAPPATTWNNLQGLFGTPPPKTGH